MKNQYRIRPFFASLAILCLLNLPLAAQSTKKKSTAKKAPALAAPAKAEPVKAAKVAELPANLPEIMPITEIKPGMKGHAMTVFSGVTPEKMEFEVLGVLRNVFGPKGDVILARMKGPKVEHTGVAGGMSGSPAYIDGKLIGALSLRIGAFMKEPIAGITPIQDMLEINELDRSTPSQNVFTPARPRWNQPMQQPAQSKTSAGDAGEFRPDPSNAHSYVPFLQPIGAPLAITGVTEETMAIFKPYFDAAGIIPVMGVGSASDEAQPEPIEPGSSVGAVIVRGDLDMSFTCTVTYADPNRLLACGHPLMQFGKVDMPMTKSKVVTTLASSFAPNKVATTTETIGSFLQDRRAGIMGKFGATSRMVPVTVNIHGGPRPRTFKYEVLNSARLTPLAMMISVYQSLQTLNEHGDEISYRMRGSIGVNGYPTVKLGNMFAPSDTAPTSLSAAMSVGERFGRIFDNSFEEPQISGVELDFDVIPERRWARLESARTDVTEARPGDELTLEVALRPYRGERVLRTIPVRIPTSAPKGPMRILVSDGDTLDRPRRGNVAFTRKLDLGSTIAAINKDRVNHTLYVSMLESNPQAMVEDKVMPALPLSVMNVMDSMRGTQDMVVIGESAVNESSTPLDFVVSGAQVITIQIK